MALNRTPLDERIQQIRAEIDAIIDAKVEERRKECPGVPPGVLRGLLTANGSGCQCEQYRQITERELMSWAGKIRQHADSVKKTAPPSRPRPRKPKTVVTETWVQLRPASGTDPGEVAPAYFTVDEGVLTVTDEKGTPIKEIKPYTLMEGDDSRKLGGHFAWKHLKEKRSDFDGPIIYPAYGVA